MLFLRFLKLSFITLLATLTLCSSLAFANPTNQVVVPKKDSSLQNVDQKIYQSILGFSQLDEVDSLLATRNALCEKNKSSCLNMSPWIKVITSHAANTYVAVGTKILLSVLKQAQNSHDLQIIWQQILDVHRGTITHPKKMLASELLLNLEEKQHPTEFSRIFHWLIADCAKGSLKHDNCLPLLTRLERRKPTNYSLLQNGAAQLWAIQDYKSSDSLLTQYIYYSYHIGERKKVVDLYEAHLGVFKNAPDESLVSLLEVICTAYRYIGKPESCLHLINAHPALKSNTGLQIELAITDYKMGSFKKALELFESLLKQNIPPLTHWIHFYSAYTYYSFGDYKKTEEILTNFAKVMTDEMAQASYSILKIRLLARQNKFSEAQQLYEKSLQTFQKNTIGSYHDIYLLKMSYLTALVLQKDKSLIEKFINENRNEFLLNDPTIQYYKLAFSLVELKHSAKPYEPQKEAFLKSRGKNDPDSLELIQALSALP